MGSIGCMNGFDRVYEWVRSGVLSGNFWGNFWAEFLKGVTREGLSKPPASLRSPTAIPDRPLEDNREPESQSDR
jgi:hypothetical protein